MSFNYTTIIPHHNLPHLLYRCLSSIPNRNDIQTIVIDDKSDEQYIQDLKEIESQFVNVSFYYLSECSGAGKARNIGLKKALGKYILFADSDDFFNYCIHDILNEYKGEDADIIYGNSISQYPDGTEIIESAHATTEWLPVHPIYRHNASFVKSGIQKKYLYDTARKKEFKYALDYLNILTFYENGCSFKKVNKTVVTYEKDGISNNPIQSCILNHRIAFRNKKESIKDRTGFYKRLAKEYLKSIIKKQ